MQRKIIWHKVTCRLLSCTVMFALAICSAGFSPDIANALPTCSALPATIGACCTITKAGTYQVSGSLTSTSGDCIDVAAARVSLNLNEAQITGSGSGVGVHVLSGATNAIVMGGAGLPGATITGFTTGLQTDASLGFFALINVESSAGDGVVVNGTQNTFADVSEASNGGHGLVDNADGLALLGFFTENNGNDGITVNSASNIRFDTVSSDGNQGNGIVLQKVRYAVVSLSEAGSFSPNTLNGLVVNGGGNNSFNELETSGNQQNGVLVENSSSSNTFSELTASGNQADGVSVHSSNSNQFSNSSANQNHLNGFELDGSNDNGLQGVSAESNGSAGIWLNGSSTNTLMYFTASENSTSGVYIGCSATTEPSGTTCSALPSSNNNFLSDGTSEKNTVGIGIDLNDQKNRVVSNTVDSNTTNLEDGNPACKTNIWEPNAPAGCAH